MHMRYIRSIRNYGILIFCYARAVRTEQYPAILTTYTFLTRAAQMYWFTHSLRTFRVRVPHGAIAMEDSEDIKRRQV